MNIFDNVTTLYATMTKNIEVNSTQALSDAESLAGKLATADFIGAGVAYYDLLILIIGSPDSDQINYIQ